MAHFFITGTDTGIGKTHVTCALLRAARHRGQKAIAMKPVASGCHPTSDGLRNADALALMDAMQDAAPAYEQVNPYALLEPVSPHIAARNARMAIDLDRIHAGYQRLAQGADWVFVEGVGGYQVPLSDQMLASQIPARLGLPVIMVVGVRLGCINHALLTAQAMRQDRLEFAGWIANLVDPALPCSDDAIAAIEQWLGCAPLATVPWGAAAAAEPACLAILQALQPSHLNHL